MMKNWPSVDASFPILSIRYLLALFFVFLFSQLNGFNVGAGVGGWITLRVSSLHSTSHKHTLNSEQFTREQSFALRLFFATFPLFSSLWRVKRILIFSTYLSVRLCIQFIVPWGTHNLTERRLVFFISMFFVSEPTILHSLWLLWARALRLPELTVTFAVDGVINLETTQTNSLNGRFYFFSGFCFLCFLYCSGALFRIVARVPV